MHPSHHYRHQPGKRCPVNSYGEPEGLEPTPDCESFSNSNRLSASLTVPRASQSSDATLHEKRPLLGQSPYIFLNRHQKLRYSWVIDFDSTR